MRVVSVDPGFSGALAVWSDEGGALKPLSVHDMPTTTEAVGKGRATKVRPVIDLAALGALMRDARPDVVVVERVGTRPGQSAQSVFRFGEAYGAVLGAAAAVGARVVCLRPQEWRSAVGLTDGAEKRASIDLARNVFSSLSDRLKRQRDDGRAEALLIGHAYHTTYHEVSA